MNQPKIPPAPRAIQKGVPLKNLLGEQAIEYLANNILLVFAEFNKKAFCQLALNGLEPLTMMQRGRHIALALRQCLPDNYNLAIDILLHTLTPAQEQTDEFGLASLFYLPHSSFIAEYGLDAKYNNGEDPFEISMAAQYQLTTSFSAEFSIRTFLINQQTRTLAVIKNWVTDKNPHIRRLCSEGTRPRLPWGKSIPAFKANPEPTLDILETLKNDTSLYVRRSVANHLGDIAKDHPELVFDICQRWLPNSSAELKWLIRHAVRYYCKQGNTTALAIRLATK